MGDKATGIIVLVSLSNIGHGQAVEVVRSLLLSVKIGIRSGNSDHKI